MSLFYCRLRFNFYVQILSKKNAITILTKLCILSFWDKRRPLDYFICSRKYDYLVFFGVTSGQYIYHLDWRKTKQKLFIFVIKLLYSLKLTKSQICKDFVNLAVLCEILVTFMIFGETIVFQKCQNTT